MTKPLRQRCRYCRSRLAAPVENEHYGFCTRGCHSSFYRSRCLVCEEPMQRKNERQRFKSGHAVCRAEYQRFPHVYELPRYHGSPTPTTAPRNADKTGLKTGDKAERRWRQIAGAELSERELRLATIDPPPQALIQGPPSDRFLGLVEAARKGPHRECRCEYCEARRLRYVDTVEAVTDAELAIAAARMRARRSTPLIVSDDEDLLRYRLSWCADRKIKLTFTLQLR